jgi:hypothetical protein
MTVESPVLRSELGRGHYEDLLEHYASVPKPLCERDKVALYSYAYAYMELGIFEVEQFHEFANHLGLPVEVTNALPL